nr:hypothetical protein [Tanacetum cinerariifolium]
MNRKPHPFNGMEGVVGLRRWIEKVERQETGKAYAATPAEGKGYNGNIPWCHRCKAHHQQGSCPPKCSRCNKLSHQEKDYQVRIPATGGNALHDVTCFGCVEKGHYRHKCPKGKNQQNEGARARAYVVVENPQQNLNVVTSSFDVIIGIDWLLYHRAVIVSYEKIVCIPLPNGEILEIQGLPSVREIEFRIDLIPGGLLVVKSPYHLAPFEMLELSNQLKELQEKEEHEAHLKMILDLLKEEKLYAKFSKCEFWLKEVQFLRHVVNRDGIHVDPSKVGSIKNWKTPESPTEICSFLGLVENKAYVWGNKQEETFGILKENLCNAPVLALPDGPNDFVVYCDASDQWFECLLMQRGKKELNIRQRHWIELLSDYECEIKYHSGKENVVADALSRKDRIKPRDRVLLKVSPWKGVIRFQKKGKLAQRYVGPFKMVECVGWKCLAESDVEVPLEEIEIDENLRFVKEATKIVKKDIKKLKRRRIPLVKVRWNSQPGAEHTWMYYDLRDLYWWPGMKRDIAEYVSKCLTLTKSAHFLPIREDYKINKLARIYINKITVRHGVLVSIISDRDGQFVSHLWQALQKALGSKLNMSTTYHHKTDDQSERTIQTLKDMLRACVMDFGGSWDTHLPSLVVWTEVGESRLIGLEIVQETTEKIVQIKKRLKTAKSRQKSYADKRRKPFDFKVGDQVMERSKANVVADALSRIERLKPRRAKILEAQAEASKDLKAPAKWLKGLETHFERRYFGGIYFFDRIWIPSVGGIRKLIMDEAHTSRYSVHLGADKMYYDLKDLYWWPDVEVPLEEIEIDENLRFVKEATKIVKKDIKKLKRRRIL